MESLTNGDRAAILARIREALREPAPRHHETSGPVAGAVPVTAPFREWLPAVGDRISKQIELFAQLSEMLRTEFKQSTAITGAAKHIAGLAKAGGWKRIATHSGELTDALAAELGSKLEIIRTDDGYDKAVLESCDAGLTECECLVAQTGSVCVTTRSSGGRALSALPPHHIVIARKQQMRPDLTSAYELLAEKYPDGYPSFMSFITGPSRTGDIERILVLGAHGPKRLSVILIP